MMTKIIKLTTSLMDVPNVFKAISKQFLNFPLLWNAHLSSHRALLIRLTLPLCLHYASELSQKKTVFRKVTREIRERETKLHSFMFCRQQTKTVFAHMFLLSTKLNHWMKPNFYNEMRKLLAIVKQQKINEIIQFRGNLWRASTS